MAAVVAGGVGQGTRRGDGLTPRETVAVFASAVLIGLGVFTVVDAHGTDAGAAIVSVVLLALAASMLVLRRIRPNRSWRWGSFSPDQMMSVAASVATVAVALDAGDGRSAGGLLTARAVLAVVLLTVTVVAPVLPAFRAEFASRPASQAHPVARRAASGSIVRGAGLVPGGRWRQPAPRYRRRASDGLTAEESVRVLAEADARMAADAAAHSGAGDDGEIFDGEVDGPAPMPAGGHVSAESGTTGLADVSESAAPSVLPPEPFWVLPPVPRQVVDEATGRPLFMITPAAWALVVAERGNEFVIRSEDGQVGVVDELDGFVRA
ncbi:hypothetical protein FM119_05775 [Mycetocola reblochoni REB411]|uniref:Uncharacterized protein n=1 Tax=Mycetocola reblochoni REB411 TaxID=1255698 RepID=A0A1R4J6J6_9MICO|nr:hypothetical protein FM119_05775 [Mycetocola reblochoni REB411]